VKRESSAKKSNQSPPTKGEKPSRGRKGGKGFWKGWGAIRLVSDGPITKFKGEKLWEPRKIKRSRENKKGGLAGKNRPYHLLVERTKKMSTRVFHPRRKKGNAWTGGEGGIGEKRAGFSDKYWGGGG